MNDVTIIQKWVILFYLKSLKFKDFTNGKEELNLTIANGESVTFKYRLIISSNSHLSDEEKGSTYFHYF